MDAFTAATSNFSLSLIVTYLMAGANNAYGRACLQSPLGTSSSSAKRVLNNLLTRCSPTSLSPRTLVAINSSGAEIEATCYHCFILSIRAARKELSRAAHGRLRRD
jgi:hypothetical protein